MGNLERHLATCKERVEHVFRKNVYQILEKLFNKLDSFNIPYSDDRKLFSNMAIFNFESICVQGDKFRDTETTSWIGKHVPISVSISSNSIENPIFLCNSNTGALVELFVDALDGLTTHSGAEMNLRFLEIETSVKKKLNQIFCAFTQSRCGKEPVLEIKNDCIEEEEEGEEEQDVSTQFF